MSNQNHKIKTSPNFLKLVLLNCALFTTGSSITYLWEFSQSGMYACRLSLVRVERFCPLPPGICKIQIKLSPHLQISTTYSPRTRKHLNCTVLTLSQGWELGLFATVFRTSLASRIFWCFGLFRLLLKIWPNIHMVPHSGTETLKRSP